MNVNLNVKIVVARLLVEDRNQNGSFDFYDYHTRVPKRLGWIVNLAIKNTVYGRVLFFFAKI